tara:strand:- start:563 stop:739 length:177 start_codon:yes stop_codon:yes gene_type:complete
MKTKLPKEKQLNSVRREWGYGNFTVVLLDPVLKVEGRKEMPEFKDTLKSLNDLSIYKK